MAAETGIAEVAVNAPVDRTFHYRIPAAHAMRIARGMRVLVPFGGRRLSGVVVGFPAVPAVPDLKPIHALLDDLPVFSERMLDFLERAARYYVHPLGQVLAGALPEGFRVRCHTVLRLTPAGEETLSEGTLPADERAALERIRQRPSGPAVGLPARMVARLRGRGLVTTVQEMLPPRARARTVTMVRAAAGSGDVLARAPRQAALLAYVRAVGEVSLPELARDAPGAAALVRRLEQRGLVTTYRRVAPREPALAPFQRSGLAPPLTAEQDEVLAAITGALDAPESRGFLLHGITGSGKTEVYLAAIAACLARQRGAILLVPELSLASPLYAEVRARFADRTALLHSALTPSERFDMWRRLKEGRARIALGARSAIFAPIEDLGLIIVDEEHEAAYKQEDRFLYHTRDMALLRGALEGAVVVFGSATPSVETYTLARDGRLTALVLPKRISDRPLPAVRIVDMRERAGGAEAASPLSLPLREGMEKTLAAGRQVILFLNRRGEETFLLCPECGFVYRCPQCSVSLTSHGHGPGDRGGRLFCCHYCNAALPPPPRCPQCAGVRIRAFGWGTQKLEAHVRAAFPQARVARLDRDVSRQRGALDRVLVDFEEGRIDILVGTQMIAKGLDVAGVTLVGVVAADLALNLPDFRAAERTFQLVTQVAGRAGRGDDPGEVIVQTYTPDHPSLGAAAGHDYDAFYAHEIVFRRERNYPPYRRLALVRAVGRDATATERAAARVAERARARAAQAPAGAGLAVLGPAPAPLVKLRGAYRWQVLLKGRHAEQVADLTRAIRDDVSPALLRTGVRLVVDVDPVNML